VSKEEAILVLMDRTLKYFVTAGLIVVVGFGLLFLIGYIIDFVEKRVKTYKRNDKVKKRNIESLKKRWKRKI